MPEVGAPVNLPGRLLLKRGQTLVTRDLSQGPDSLEHSLNLLELNDEGTRARLINRHLLENRLISKISIDRQAGREDRLVALPLGVGGRPGTPLPRPLRRRLPGWCPDHRGGVALLHDPRGLSEGVLPQEPASPEGGAPWNLGLPHIATPPACI